MGNNSQEKRRRTRRLYHTRVKQNGKVVRPIIQRQLIKAIYANAAEATKALPSILKPRPRIEQSQMSQHGNM